LLHREKGKIKTAIFWGTMIPALLMAIFVFFVVGVTGESTSPDALTGLQGFFQNGVMTFALIFGLICVITSFLVIGQSLREVYWWDAKLNKNFAWLLAGVVPYLIYLLGISDLTKVIGFTGSVIGGVFGIVLIWLLFQAKRKRDHIPPINVNLNKGLAFVLITVFVLGLFYEIYYLCCL
jgi:amino acid permease